MMDNDNRPPHDRTPGVEEYESGANLLSYTVGLVLAILATIASFVVAQTDLLWSPGITVGLVVLAIAQIGVHQFDPREPPAAPGSRRRYFRAL